MGSNYIYDPDDIEGLVEHWFSDVGGLYAGRKYNGFILLNDEREVLDMFVSDVEDEALLDEDQDRNGYDILVDRVLETPGANHVICMHGHTTDVPTGPCFKLEEFAGTMVIELATRAQTTFHFVVVLRGNKLDGVLTAQLPTPLMNMLLEGDVEGAKAMADALHEMPDPMSADPAEMARGILSTGVFDDNDTLRNALTQLAKGEHLDVNDLLDAIEEIGRLSTDPDLSTQASDLVSRARKARNINPLSLPRLELPRGNLLN
jgi:hypothetical protein